MPSPRRPVRTFATLPDPGQADTLDDLVERLRLLKVWSGGPSYEWIKDRVNAAWTEAGWPAGDLAGKTTVVDCFRPGRRRLNADLVVAVVQALHPDVGYVAQWRQALRVIGGQTQATAQVRVQDRLPQDLAGFTGRTAELDQLRRASRHGTAVISAITGMAGVGKTQLAIHAAHVLAAEHPFDRVLFVNLRGFHPDPGQPPVDPAAVLDGFLRLLGMPGQQIPHDLRARSAAYHDRLAGTRTLVVLDNVADEDQVGPLLAEHPGCVTLVTSRRSLTALHTATHVAIDVFTPDEAVAFLAAEAPGVPVGDDPDAAARIADRCGLLPLALGLVAGHMRGTPGWTLTDHAHRLDERHRDRRLDTSVELALDLSYQQLPADRQRLLRLAALHPGQDLDLYAGTALSGSDLPTTRTLLRHLCRDHLLQQVTAGRYTFHDLVRAYANGQARDEDSPPARRAALTRLFDYYLSTTATAMDILYPAETDRRPRIAPPVTPMPVLADPDTARAWLDVERPSLVAVAAHGQPTHATRLSTTLFRYLAGGHHTDALAIHGHAAQHADDPTGQGHALTNLGVTHMLLGRHEQAADHLQRAMDLFRQAGDQVGQARALDNLGNVEMRLGQYGQAADHLGQALHLVRQTDHRAGEANSLVNLGVAEARLGRHHPAIDHLQQAVHLFRQAGHQAGEAGALTNLGVVETRLGRLVPAAEHLHEALTLCRQLGIRVGEAWTLDGLGTLHTHLGQPTEATDRHRQALAIFRDTGDRDGEAWALNGLGEAARAAGHPADAIVHHTAAHAVAADVGARVQQARAHTGLALADPKRARHHYQRALIHYTDLGMPDADRIRAHLDTVAARQS